LADKLAAIAAAAAGKLVYGGETGAAPGDSDLTKFRKDSLDKLKRQIRE
jgi:hypothetical protein